MFGRVHVYVTAAPGAIDANAGISAFVRLQWQRVGKLNRVINKAK